MLNYEMKESQCVPVIYKSVFFVLVLIFFLTGHPVFAQQGKSSLNITSPADRTASASLSGTGTAATFPDFEPKLHIYDQYPFGFHMRGKFTEAFGGGGSYAIGNWGSDGRHPTLEAVTLTIGNHSLTIPAGSFKLKWPPFYLFVFPDLGGNGFILSKLTDTIFEDRLIMWI
jgi:hypothetical protein